MGLRGINTFVMNEFRFLLNEANTHNDKFEISKKHANLDIPHAVQNFEFCSLDSQCKDTPRNDFTVHLIQVSSKHCSTLYVPTNLRSCLQAFI